MPVGLLITLIARIYEVEVGRRFISLSLNDNQAGEFGGTKFQVNRIYGAKLVLKRQRQRNTGAVTTFCSRLAGLSARLTFLYDKYYHSEKHCMAEIFIYVGPTQLIFGGMIAFICIFLYLRHVFRARETFTSSF